MRQIGTFCFDDDTNEFVFGDKENGMRLSNDGITFIRNGQRISFDEVVKEASLVEWAPRVHGKWINKNGYVCCSKCGRESVGAPKGYELMINNGDEWVSITRTKFCGNCGALMDLEVLDGESN